MHKCGCWYVTTTVTKRHTHKHLKEHNSVNCEKMNRLLSVIAAADWGLFICQNCSRLTTQVKARNSEFIIRQSRESHSSCLGALFYGEIAF